jgi:hypothetical protein
MLMNKQDERGCGCAEQVLALPRVELGCACELTPAYPGRGEPRVAPGSNCGHCDCPEDQRHHTCGFGVDGGVLAAVWVPLNRFEDLYDTDTAMRRGTLFAALDKPFYGEGKGVDCRGNER